MECMWEAGGEGGEKKKRRRTMNWKFPATDHRKIILPVIAFVLLFALSYFSFFFQADDRFRALRASRYYAPSCARTGGSEEAGGRPRIAVCLVGGARRFELTGPSLLERVVNVFNNSDLFLNSPLDQDSYKFFLLKEACRIAAVRIVKQKPVPETPVLREVVSSVGSPSGLHGIMYYFKLVEGCLDMIDDYQTKNRIQYDWIVRTRVDGYWSEPLSSRLFVPGTYVIPSGYQYGGLNDRLGVGDLNTSRIALSRFSMLPSLHEAGFRDMRSEPAFKAQLDFKNVKYEEVRVHFCVVSDRSFWYPPDQFGTIVGSMGSRSPLSGAYCRPCWTACNPKCASSFLQIMDRHWGWIDSEPELCDARGPWASNWEWFFDKAVGKKYAVARKRIRYPGLDRCVAGLESVKRRAGSWDAPSPVKICMMGFAKKLQNE